MARQQYEEDLQIATALGLADADMGETDLGLAAVLREMDDKIKRSQDLRRQCAEAEQLKEAMILQMQSLNLPEKRKPDEDGASSSPPKVQKNSHQRSGSMFDLSRRMPEDGSDSDLGA